MPASRHWWFARRASDFECVPGGVDNLNENSPPPVEADFNGRYPVPVPGQWVEV